MHMSAYKVPSLLINTTFHLSDREGEGYISEGRAYIDYNF